MRNISLRSVYEWRTYNTPDMKPDDIPIAPHYVYAIDGWAAGAIGSGKAWSPPTYLNFASSKQSDCSGAVVDQAKIASAATIFRFFGYAPSGKSRHCTTFEP